MNRTALLALLPLVFSTTAAFSEASDESAAHLTEVFQTYLGTTEGVVSVVVEGDSYSVTLDAAPLSAMATEAGGSASMTPIVLSLTDNGDGTWDVSQDQPFSMSFAIPGQSDYTATYGSLTLDGVFDEALMTFSTAKGAASDIKTVQKMTDPNMGDVSIETTIAALTTEMTGQAGASGGVDGTYSFMATGYNGSFVTPASDGMPPMSVGYTIESATQTGQMTGLRSDAIYKAFAWFVAHPSQEAMQADKAAMKTILAGGFPLFGSLTGDVVAKNILVNSPMGDIGIAEVGVKVEANGVVADGRVREAFSISGVTLPAGLVPEWAAPILPQKLSFDVEVTDFDAAAAAQVALGLFDLPAGTEPDAVFEADLLAALLPNKTVTITMNPGGLSGDGYALTYEGSMVAGPEMPVPTGKALITLTGIETLQAALDAAPEDIKGQAMMPIGMAQGMAKAGANGELIWEIDASTPGSLSVNGMNMMGGN